MTTQSPLAVNAARFRSAYAMMLFSHGFAVIDGTPAHRRALATWRAEQHCDANLLDMLDAASDVMGEMRRAGVDLDHAVVAVEAAVLELQSALRVGMKGNRPLLDMLYAARRGA